MSNKFAPFRRQALAIAACWLVLTVPAYFVAGVAAVEGVSYAALLCIVPAGLALLKAAIVVHANPLVDLLIGMGLRMVVVLGGAWLIVTIWPEMTGRTFLYWLIPLYGVALTVETHQVLQAESLRSSAAQSVSSD